MSSESTPSLHPNNHRVGTSGLGIGEYLDYYRYPPVYVTADGDEQHETPMCPNARGQVHYAICREDALYTYGERWCDTCRLHAGRVDFLEQEGGEA